MQMVTGLEPPDQRLIGAYDSAGVTEDSGWPPVGLLPCFLVHSCWEKDHVLSRGSMGVRALTAHFGRGSGEERCVRSVGAFVSADAFSGVITCLWQLQTPPLSLGHPSVAAERELGLTAACSSQTFNAGAQKTPHSGGKKMSWFPRMGCVCTRWQPVEWVSEDSGARLPGVPA